MKARIEKYQKKLWQFFVVPFENRKYVRTPALFEFIADIDPEKFLVITSAFNDVSLVDMQNRALKKFLDDPYQYFVVDNSTKEDQAEKIKQYCIEHRISYIRLPENIGNKKRASGIAHGLALNWAYCNVVRRFKPRAFSFWDFDLFPTKPVKVSRYLAVSEAWGIVIKLKPFFKPWHYPAYLWVGLLFFRTERFKNVTPDFLPDFGVDTGGKIPLDEKIIKALPDMVNFYESPLVEIAPEIRVRRLGDFIHFEGSSSALPNSLDVKKAWMEKILQS